MDYILLAVGFALLIKGADFFVDGSSAVAKKFKVPPILIGLTIVAFGTSAPEASVSVNAALKGSNQIAIGNVVGSNLFNFLLVVGISAVINPVRVQKGTILKEFPFTILTSFVLLILSADVLLQDASSNMLSRADGLVLFALFSIFVYYLVELALLSKEDYKEEAKNISLAKSAVMGIVGVAGIIVGADWVVKASSSIALHLGMSENLVGLTIVAVGTSLPELVTSVVAAFKNESDIAMGNVVGSNIFNILFILGISSVIRPIEINPVIFTDMIYLIAVTFVIYMFAITKRTVNKIEGSMLSLLYIGYMVFIIIRN